MAQALRACTQRDGCSGHAGFRDGADGPRLHGSRLLGSRNGRDDGRHVGDGRPSHPGAQRARADPAGRRPERRNHGDRCVLHQSLAGREPRSRLLRSHRRILGGPRIGGNGHCLTNHLWPHEAGACGGESGALPAQRQDRRRGNGHRLPGTARALETPHRGQTIAAGGRRKAHRGTISEGDIAHGPASSIRAPSPSTTAARHATETCTTRWSYSMASTSTP